MTCPGRQFFSNDLVRSFREAWHEELLAHEEAGAIAPGLTPDELRGALRAIYPPEKEALGVVALEIDLL